MRDAVRFPRGVFFALTSRWVSGTRKVRVSQTFRLETLA